MGSMGGELNCLEDDGRVTFEGELGGIVLGALERCDTLRLRFDWDV